MDKLYSKQAKILKSVFCICLAPLYILLSSLLTLEDAFLYVMLSSVPVGCIYTVPFWLTLVQIKRYRVSKIGKYVLIDALCNLVPAITGVLTSEIINTVLNGASAVDGVVTAIFSTVFIVVALIFWLLYFVFSYKK